MFHETFQSSVDFIKCGARRPGLVPRVRCLQARASGWWIIRPLYACLDALPLLQAAAKVRVADVAGFLDRHGVHTEAEPCVDADRSVGDELILAAEQRGADLIVAGAYGHTRLRE
jgi:nucleotide-binding universal stress UspA family protein